MDSAWERLDRSEGKPVSVREVCRRAEADPALQAKVFYHLNRKRHWVEGHRVPREVVAMLASQLPIEEEELLRAAHIAAGYDVELNGDGAPDQHVRAIARFWGREDISEARKQQLYEELMDLMREEYVRQRQSLATG